VSRQPSPTIKSSTLKFRIRIDPLEEERADISSAEPSFESNKDGLLQAGKCTCMLLIDHGTEITTGTAFFVAPSLLITAGHCVANLVKSQLILSLPGQEFINADKLRNGDMAGLKCTVKATLFKQGRSSRDWTRDIAILETGYISPNYLDLSQTHLEVGAVVDVIGYPGDIPIHWLRRHHGLDSADQSKATAEKLLPMRHLTISRGNVAAANSTVTYNVSTCRGMSGASLTSGGKAYGIFIILLLAKLVGVHIGQVNGAPDNLPMAVLFAEDDVNKFLHKHNLIEE
jgi:V8-like Glu-specific endopeptidase